MEGYIQRATVDNLIKVGILHQISCCSKLSQKLSDLAKLQVFPPNFYPNQLFFDKYFDNLQLCRFATEPIIPNYCGLNSQYQNLLNRAGENIKTFRNRYISLSSCTSKNITSFKHILFCFSIFSVLCWFSSCECFSVFVLNNLVQTVYKTGVDNCSNS